MATYGRRTRHEHVCVCARECVTCIFFSLECAELHQFHLIWREDVECSARFAPLFLLRIFFVGANFQWKRIIVCLSFSCRGCQFFAHEPTNERTMMAKWQTKKAKLLDTNAERAAAKKKTENDINSWMHICARLCRCRWCKAYEINEWKIQLSYLFLRIQFSFYFFPSSHLRPSGRRVVCPSLLLTSPNRVVGSLAINLSLFLCAMRARAPVCASVHLCGVDSYDRQWLGQREMAKI